MVDSEHSVLKLLLTIEIYLHLFTVLKKNTMLMNLS